LVKVYRDFRGGEGVGLMESETEKHGFSGWNNLINGYPSFNKQVSKLEWVISLLKEMLWVKFSFLCTDIFHKFRKPEKYFLLLDLVLTKRKSLWAA
jgi:hypothetical protein